MAELEREIGQAARQVGTAWSPDRAQRVWQGISARRAALVRRKRAVRWAGPAALLLLGMVLWQTLPSDGKGQPSQVLAETPHVLPLPSRVGPPTVFSDGSQAWMLGQQARLSVREARSERLVVSLSRGAAEFSVVKNPKRLFRVEAGEVAVEVLGTRFSVEHLEAGRDVRVTVSEGRVRVLQAAQYTELAAGESATFAASEGESEEEEQAPSAEAPSGVNPAASADRAAQAPATEMPASRLGPHHESGANKAGHGQAAPRSAGMKQDAQETEETAPGQDWQKLAVEGRFAQAFGQAFGGKGKDAQDTLSGRSPVELLLLADVARLSGHPAESVAPLSMLLASFGSDPRAPLAAFTLGRVLLDDLGRPREAAERFHAAYQWEQEGPLAQDALAREVEAWSRAGETAQARARAREYMRLYPAGRRLLSVRHYAELTGEAD